jgi:hypothetical protein
MFRAFHLEFVRHSVVNSPGCDCKPDAISSPRARFSRDHGDPPEIVAIQAATATSPRCSAARLPRPQNRLARRDAI